MDTRNTTVYEENPREKANPLSSLFFWWTIPLFSKGAHKDLELSDLYKPLKADGSEKLGNALEREWKRELRKLKNLEYTLGSDGHKKSTKQAGPSLLLAIARTFGARYLFLGFFLFIQIVVLRTIQPILQGWIVNYFDIDAGEDKPTKNEALLYAGVLIICTIAIVLIMHHCNSKAQQIGMEVRVACSSLVYRKSLRLSKAALTQTATGQVINLLSNDMNRFDLVPFFLNHIWVMPCQVVIIGYIMWLKVGICAIIGIACLIILCLPGHSILSICSRRLRAKIAILTDQRIQLMNELINGIQVIKMYAWEIPFQKIVAQTRRAEIKKITQSSYVRATYIAVIMFTERTALFFTLVAYVLLGNNLKPEITYVMSTYFNILQLSTALFFPQGLIMAGEGIISVRRIQRFLLLDEISMEDPPKSLKALMKKAEKEDIMIGKSEKEALELNQEPNPVSLEMTRVSANWVKGQLPPTLCNISLKVEQGQFCALVGAVGSGKSSLLHLILKELPMGAGTLKILRNEIKNGTTSVRGYIADANGINYSYSGQEPWLFAGTVRENILFGQPFERSRYVEVTKVCALSKDFQQLPHGDMTIVGERGVSLSGGQRARINLARAIYRKADIYLLDDPLSAVDTKVAQHLFKKCIEEFLHGKTRILVTHQLQFIKRADVITVLDRGTIKMMGTYDKLVQHDPEFNEMINRLNENSTLVKENTVSRRNSKRPSTRSIVEKRASFRRLSHRSSIQSTASTVSLDDDDDPPTMPSSTKDNEALNSGRLANDVYKRYFKQGGNYFSLFILALLFILTQVSTSGTDYWVSYWTNLETVRSHKQYTNDLKGNYEYQMMFNNSFLGLIFTLDGNGLLKKADAIRVYAFCIVCCIAIVLIRSFFYMHICMSASRNLHNAMFSNLLQATMRFFHVNPSGRILNRFSKDVGAMDELLPKAMLEAVQVGLVMIGILIMEVIINQWMLIPLVILGIIFYVVRLYYLRTAQSIKRLEGISKSPVFSHVNATLVGLPTIRSSGKETEILLRREFDRLQDVHTSAWYLTITTSTAFGLLVDMVACTFVVCVCFSFLLMDETHRFGGDVGLAISQSLIMTGTLQYGVRQSNEVISQMTSVERILQYINVPKESPLTSPDPPPPTWPPKGRVTFHKVNMRYSDDDPPVLKNLNVTIEPGWKVGVVGRTGAGKSSLISALFRLFGEGLEGEIKIDGKDTATLGLQELRSRISIIPQEPVLFTQSLRYNLDPFDQYNDVALWDVLRDVELNDTVLDQQVLSSGNNFSVGQRQLICLARVILRNNRILILDEATANIDTRTDALIQKAIRTRFTDCTVITIAHRLNTIIDSDRIIVMDDGRIVEFGCPYELLRDKPNGHFSQMVSNTGAAMAQSLMEQAEEACKRNNVHRSLDLSRQSSANSTEATSIDLQYTL